MAAHSKKEYFVIFVLLGVLTVLEIGAAKLLTGAPKGLSLVGLAVTKAAIVALYFMHLKHETRVLRRVVALPLLVPPFYAVVLMLEAIARRGG